MSRHRSITVFATLTIIAGLLLWSFNVRNQPAPEAAPPASTSKKFPPSSNQTLPAAPPLTEPLPTFGSEDFNRLAKERGAAWMSARNRDAGSLLALWDLTGDEALLREAAERFPNNPQVSLAMLCLLEDKEGHEAEKQQWTDQMITNDPDNPLGFYFRAKLALGKNDKSSVVAALEAALAAKGRINHYTRESMMTAKEGLLASGVSPKDTYQLSIIGTLTRTAHGQMVLGQFTGFFGPEMESLKSAGQMDKYQETAALGLRLSEQIRLTESPTLIAELFAAGMRMRFLKDLDPATEIANTRRTIEEELALAQSGKETLSALMKQMEPAQNWLETAPLEVQAQYADRMMMDGEMAAIKYLFTQMPKP